MLETARSLDPEFKVLIGLVVGLLSMVVMVDVLNEEEKFKNVKVENGGLALTPNQVERVRSALRSAYYQLESEGQGGEESEACKTADEMLSKMLELEGGESTSAKAKEVEQT